MCIESEACLPGATHSPSQLGTKDEGAYPCECSGWGNGDLNILEIVDQVWLPEQLTPGDYVLAMGLAGTLRIALLLCPFPMSHPTFGFDGEADRMLRLLKTVRNLRKCGTAAVT